MQGAITLAVVVVVVVWLFVLLFSSNKNCLLDLTICDPTGLPSIVVVVVMVVVVVRLVVVVMVECEM